MDYDVPPDERTSEVIPRTVNDLVATCGTKDCYDHVSPIPIPSLDAVIEIIEIGRRILFPGYFTRTRIDPVGLEYYLGQEVTAMFEKLATQITWSFRHDCFRYDLECLECTIQGREKALLFIESLGGLRKILGTDVQAALQGDPASRSVDQIIFSYPGLFAVSVYRMAHVLHELDVSLLPRIMTEYAHQMTGIDIHPGAEIGESFFIDHGTGVVVGETTEIGDRVRLYQGVTLGALSLPLDAGTRLQGKKRHPTIEDDVIIYAGATILGGDTVIGARSIVGGNVWLTESVPPDTKVVIKTPELIFMGKKRQA
jgi:serine O-acetyltransferase